MKRVFILTLLKTAVLNGQTFGPPGNGDYSASISISPDEIIQAREAIWYAPGHGFEPLR
jgi:hypothetical protein